MSIKYSELEPTTERGVVCHVCHEYKTVVDCTDCGFVFCVCCDDGCDGCGAEIDFHS